MSNMLNIARGLQLPHEYVTQTGALLAVRGAGKTNAARVMAEEFFAAGLPFVAIDPVGSWYGLRAGRDGGADGGLPIFIFGGDHGDVPLLRGAGNLVADLIVEQRLTCVIDLSAFESEAEKKQFLLDFARRLYQKNRDPLHLFLEEADDYIPQRPLHDELQLKRAWENIVRRGRGRGLGMTIITQRSAVVNKDVLTQVENLFVLRTTGPQDIAAIEAWVKFHKVDEKVLESLAGLDDGEAWVWSPHFLKAFKRFKFRMSNTFDSGATPKNLKGKSARKVAYLHDVDVAKLRTRLADVLEKAQQENPAVLRSRIAKLTADLHSAQKDIERLKAAKTPVIKVRDMSAHIEKLGGFIMSLAKTSERSWESVKDLRAILADGTPSLAAKGGGVSTLIPDKAATPKLSATRSMPLINMDKGAVRLEACPRALLNVLVQKQGEEVTATYVSIASGYSLKSSGFANGLSTLRTAGYITGSKTNLAATPAGIAAMPNAVPLPTGRALLDYWKDKVDATPRAQLEVIYDAYPKEVSKEYIAEHSGRSLTSSGFANGLSTLRGLGLITGYKLMKASDEFF